MTLKPLSMHQRISPTEISAPKLKALFHCYAARGVSESRPSSYLNINIKILQQPFGNVFSSYTSERNFVQSVAINICKSNRKKKYFWPFSRVCFQAFEVKRHSRSYILIRAFVALISVQLRYVTKNGITRLPSASTCMLRYQINFTDC